MSEIHELSFHCPECGGKISVDVQGDSESNEATEIRQLHYTQNMAKCKASIFVKFLCYLNNKPLYEIRASVIGETA